MTEIPRYADTGDLEVRFNFWPAKDQATADKHMNVRALCYETARAFDELCPQGREKALAITKLEEAMMWANASIARNQL